MHTWIVVTALLFFLSSQWEAQRGDLRRHEYRSDMTHQMAHTLLKMGYRPPHRLVEEIMHHIPVWLEEPNSGKLVTTLWICAHLGLHLVSVTDP